MKIRMYSHTAVDRELQPDRGLPLVPHQVEYQITTMPTTATSGQDHYDHQDWTIATIAPFPAPSIDVRF